jgi:CRP/FNR family transcriptional regulator, cyclic AMP receptor protein
MDTSVFFNYPTLPAAGGPPQPTADDAFLAHATEAEWEAVLGATETLRFRSGDVVLRAGDRDRAFYLLLDGRLEAVGSAPAGGGAEAIAPATLGVAAFLEAGPRAVTMLARTDGELARMSWDAFEALAARDARLGRQILLDLGRGLALRLHAAGATLPGWTG